jgi:hypothetical protein
MRAIVTFLLTVPLLARLAERYLGTKQPNVSRMFGGLMKRESCERCGDAPDMKVSGSWVATWACQDITLECSRSS